MRYLKTDKATNWPKDDWKIKLTRILLFFIPEANPDYNDKMQFLAEWYIEFGDDNEPFREIGLDGNKQPILAGPDKRNYGFWLDTNMKYDDFERDIITREEFENLWSQFFGSKVKSE